MAAVLFSSGASASDPSSCWYTENQTQLTLVLMSKAAVQPAVQKLPFYTQNVDR